SQCCQLNIKSLVMKIQYLFCFFTILFLFSCKKKVTVFEEISADHSDIHFNNKIVENDSINPLDMINVTTEGEWGLAISIMTDYRIFILQVILFQINFILI